MTGSHEVSGSIPLISTKTKSHSERNGFLFWSQTSGARSLRFDRLNLLRGSAAAASQPVWHSQTDSGGTEQAKLAEYPAYLHQKERHDVCRVFLFGPI